MTFNTHGNWLLTIEFRTAVGLDLEFTDSRLVWVNRKGVLEPYVGELEGVIIGLPFLMISWGVVYA
jgi:hypothetical protein